MLYITFELGDSFLGGILNIFYLFFYWQTRTKPGAAPQTPSSLINWLIESSFRLNIFTALFAQEGGSYQQNVDKIHFVNPFLRKAIN